MEYTYCPNPNAEEPVILVSTHIGEGGITGTQFAQELYSLCEMGKKSITIEINSEGGNVFDGYAINCAILECQEKYNIAIDTLNGGIAASAAGCFFQTGTKRIMYDYASLMLHNPFTSDGSEDKGLERIRLSLVTLISKRSGLSEAKVEELLNDTSWINAEDCLKLGLVDEIKSSEKMDKKVKADIINKIQVKSVQFLNKITKNNKFNMNEIIKILNEAGSTITDSASETEVYDAMRAFTAPKAEDKTDCKPEMDDKVKNFTPMEDKMKEMEDKYKVISDAYNEVVNELIKMKNEAKAKADAEMDDKIDKIIKDNVNIGKIASASIPMAKMMAKANFSLFEKYLDASPINKTAPSFEIKSVLSKEDAAKPENAYYTPETDFSNYKPSLIQAKTGEIINNLTAYTKK